MRTAHYLLPLLLTVSMVASVHADPAREPFVSACLKADVDTRDPARLHQIIKDCSATLMTKDLQQQDQADALEQRGVAYRNQGKLQSSLSDLLKAKSLAPNDAGISRMLAWTYRGLDRHGEAEREYDRSLQIDPHWQAYLSRCVVRIDQGQYHKALADCEIARKQEKSEDALFFIALIHTKLGQHREVISLLEPELNGQWASGRLYRLLSAAYTATGRSDEGKRLVEEARRKFPNDPKLNLPPPSVR